MSKETREPRAIRDRIIVAPIAPTESKTPGGVLLADTQVNPRTKHGRVVAVGDGKVVGMSEGGYRSMPCEVRPAVKVGDEIVFDTKYAINTVINGTQYVVVKEDDVLAIV